MNPEGHDDAPQNGDNNSVKPTQPEPQAPQGIFSSGDLAVHSENLDAIKPELSDENKSRIASAFAQTDATQKHDQLAGQMADQDAVSGDVIPAGGIGSASGAGFGSNATAASTSGDIRLPGKKKGKLPLILAGFALLAVIGGVVAWLVLGRKDSSSNQPVTALSATEEAFAKYASYLLYGEEKNTLEGEYDTSRSYTLNQQLDASDYNQDYWDKASELLDKAAATLAEADNSAKNELTSALDNYRQNFNFVKYYKRAGNLDEEALFGTFFTSGMDGVATALNDFYAGFSLLNSSAASAYAEQRIQQYTDSMQIYNIYDELGCIHDGVVDEVACSTLPPTQQSLLMGYSESLARSARQADTTLQNAIQYLASYCWDFDSWLKNPQQLEESANE